VPASDSGPLALAPGARILWRAAGVTQWELPDRALIVDGAHSRDIAALIGAADHGDPVAEPGSDGALGPVRAQLRSAGFLHRPTRTVAARGAAGRPPGTPERLLADLHALVPRFGDGAAATMTARRTRSATIMGADRLAAAIAALLAAAGVGRVDLAGPGPARLEHAMPGGLRPQDEGRPWREAAGDAVRRAAPETEIGSGPGSAAPDLVIATGPRPMADDLRQQLHDDSQPYLCVGVDGARAVIGPLVLPGWSSCARCLEMHRRDRDPAWWALAAQLSTASPRTPASDVALCAIAAGIAASQALALLDGEQPTTVEATIEMTLPDWRLRRRARPAHPDCACLAA